MTLDTPITVLGRNTSSNVQKVMWLLAEINRGCERIDVGGKYGGKKEGSYLGKNPNGVVPTVIHGDIVIWESNTILRYLANVFRLSELYPNDPAERANVERWMDWQLPGKCPVVSEYCSYSDCGTERRCHRTAPRSQRDAPRNTRANAF
ncbi:glutathione S-transferase N-terminal domain-containing protein [Paraburkholderia youngii]|uniref:glutathione S-transferase N-terminal domain-containing protein n=1 Tax=Paraburkholderia youngii TaxID=2782701 RepID=UPI003D24B7D9